MIAEESAAASLFLGHAGESQSIFERLQRMVGIPSQDFWHVRGFARGVSFVSLELRGFASRKYCSLHSTAFGHAMLSRFVAPQGGMR
jgi:hypothetical protein